MINAHNTIVEDYEYISRHDDALDSGNPAFEDKWQKYLDGVGQVPLRDGHAPTKFKMRHIQTSQKAQISEHMSKAAEDNSLWQKACYEAARIALVDCSGLVDVDGSDFKIKRVRVDGVSKVSEETINKLPYEVLIELGAVAISKMAPRPS